MRKRREQALADHETISKEFRKGVRCFVKEIHGRKDTEDEGNETDRQTNDAEKLSPEVLAFIKQVSCKRVCAFTTVAFTVTVSVTRENFH